MPGILLIVSRANRVSRCGRTRARDPGRAGWPCSRWRLSRRRRATRLRVRTGAPGSGDRIYPRAGNGGYQVDHYRLQLGYDPATGRLRRSRAHQSASPSGGCAGSTSTSGGCESRSLRVAGRGGPLPPPRPGADRPASRSAGEARALPRRRALRRHSAADRVSAARARSAGSPPTMAPSSPPSPRERRPGSPATTTRSTRRPTGSGSTVPAGHGRRSRTDGCRASARPRRPARSTAGRRAGRWPPTWRP